MCGCGCCCCCSKDASKLSKSSPAKNARSKPSTQNRYTNTSVITCAPRSK